MAAGDEGAVAERLERPRIAVLGPVELVSGTSSRPLRGRTARLLLGLVASNTPRTIEQLAEVVWGPDPPPTHRAALHVHLGTLRRLLAETGIGAAIHRTGDAYTLELLDCEIDSLLARDLVDAARGQVVDDPAAAVGILDRALALWRGTPFAVDGEAVDAAASHQADALSREAEELLVEGLLAVGDAPRAEAAAERFVAAEPLRENRWGQLLRARYLAGRTGDALDTFQQARTTLVDMIGIEPGQELRSLEAAALTHDRASLFLPLGRTPSATRQPPPRTGAFIGREVELQRVLARVAQGQSVSIQGPPGVGKSRLALEVAHHVAGQGVAWVNLRDADPATTIEYLAEWVRTHSDGLVVFDNVELHPDIGHAAVDIQRRAPGVGVILTSRVPVQIDISVEVLEPLELPAAGADDVAIERSPAARALRAALAELAPTTSLSASDVERICRRAGGLPLVLRLAAAAARALPASALAEDAVAAVDDAIDRAVDSLLEVVTERAGTAFIDLAVLASGFDVPLGARVADLAEHELADVVVHLVDHGLLQARPEEPLPYSMLEPIREAADRLLSIHGRRSDVLSRHADACVERARAFESWAASGRSGLENALSASLPRMHEALDHLVQTGDPERALTLVCRLEAPLYVLGWWAEKVELFDLALAVPGPKSAMRARAHAFRARPGPLHLFDALHAERAEAIATELGRPLLVAFAKHLRSIGAWWHGDLAQAIELSQEATESFAAAGRTLEWGEARKFLGVAMLFDGDVQGGLEVQHEALTAARRAGATPFQVAHGVAYLGHCHRMLGDDAAALADWTEARELCRSVGNRGTAIHVDIGLADLAVDRGDVQEALARAAEALDLIHEARGWTYESWAWTVAARAHAVVGDDSLAAACGRRAARALPHGPEGETVRLAQALAELAMTRDDVNVAARLLGVVEGREDRRELPFPPKAERDRLQALREAVAARLGPAGRDLVAAGARLSITEAAGSLLNQRP